MKHAIVLLLFAVTSADHAGAQPLRDPIGLLAEYANVVEGYRRGGVDGVEAELKKWDDRRLSDVIVLLLKVRDSNPVLLDTRIARPDLGGWSMPLIGAAVLLHADVFLQHAKRGVREPRHLDIATRFLSLYTGSAAEPMFRLHATLCILWMRQITGQFTELDELFVTARKEFADSPEIAVAEGCLEESAASPRAARRPFVSEALGRSAEHYRRALSLDPAFAEARVRLGFVLFRLGRPEEASRELERARQEARDARVAYLARLFAGMVHERAGRYQDAAAAYRDARRMGLECHVAAVALSHVFYRAGDRKAAAAIALEAGGFDDTRCEDPWWSYDYGQAYKVEDRMAALRREVRR
jgi:hypothetical protein